MRPVRSFLSGFILLAIAWGPLSVAPDDGHPLALLAAPQAVAQGPVPGIPFIDEAHVTQEVENGPVFLHLLGHFPPGCWGIESVAESPRTLLMSQMTCGDSMNVWPNRWRWTFGLGELAAGRHAVRLVLLHEESPDAVDPIVYEGFFEFALPVTRPRMPYLEEIRIEPATDIPVVRPICSSDSIRVSLRGHFPNPCFSLEKVEVLDLAMTPVPGPPFISLTVERGGCLDPCPEVLEPWSASVVLPPLPPGRYSQILQMIEVTCDLPDSVVARHSTAAPFSVSAECGADLRCLWPGFEHPNGWWECDAFVSPGNPGKVTFTVASTVALAGLQGDFVLDPSVLRIVAMEPTGPAQGMHLNWVPTADGARFTLFAESGAPITPCPGDPRDPRCGPNPVITLTVAALDNRIPEGTRVNVREVLGSDVDGQGVGLCPFPSDTGPSRFVLLGARICAERDCDFNADGRTDVRDLVLMVHCVNDSATCSGRAFDCNRDSVTSIADVICCAIHMLRDGHICPECPPDTTRPAPRVRATLDEPQHTETGVELPLSLIGAEFLGGALLEFDFPADRYEASVSLAGASSTWLELDEVRDGKLAVGLVRTSPMMTGDIDQRLNLTVRLTLKPGQTPGGEVSYAGGEFSGWDGTLLEVHLGDLTQPLGGGVQIELSAPRPNPSGGETRFSLILDRPADVELGVYDLGGRRVATVHRGALDAGQHEFQWQGRDDQGELVANGIYFYRATGGGAAVTRKLVLLRGR